MSNKKVHYIKKGYQFPISICWKCANSYGKCSWSENFIPVEGSEWIEKDLYDKNKELVVKIITKCPKFKKEIRGSWSVQ